MLGRMRRLILTLGIAAVAAFGLSACAQTADTTDPEPTPIGSDVVAPVTEDLDALEGATIDLRVGQVLNINTGDLAVDSISGEVEDPDIAEFTAGSDDGSAQFNPGVTALAEGTTTVVLFDDDDSTEDISFLLNVGP